MYDPDQSIRNTVQAHHGDVTYLEETYTVLSCFKSQI
jgi:hypothetical protein